MILGGFGLDPILVSERTFVAVQHCHKNSIIFWDQKLNCKKQQTSPTSLLSQFGRSQRGTPSCSCPLLQIQAHRVVSMAVHHDWGFVAVLLEATQGAARVDDRFIASSLTHETSAMAPRWFQGGPLWDASVGMLRLQPSVMTSDWCLVGDLTFWLRFIYIYMINYIYL